MMLIVWWIVTPHLSLSVNSRVAQGVDKAPPEHLQLHAVGVTFV